MSNPYDPPQTNPFANQPLPPPKPSEGDATGGVIPYKNPYALSAYYGGILTMLCCVLPLPLGIIPLVLGVIGLRERAKNPVIKGSVHAWIGIILGGLSAICSCLILIGLIAAFLGGEFR